MTITLQDLDLPPRGDTRDSSDAHTHTTAMSARESHRAAGHPRVYSSAVEHRIADPAVAGSIPAAPLTFWVFFFFFFSNFCYPLRFGRSVARGTKHWPRHTVPVAQLDKASDYESEDWGFGSPLE